MLDGSLQGLPRGWRPSRLGAEAQDGSRDEDEVARFGDCRPSAPAEGVGSPGSTFVRAVEWAPWRAGRGRARLVVLCRGTPGRFEGGLRCSRCVDGRAVRFGEACRIGHRPPVGEAVGLLAEPGRSEPHRCRRRDRPVENHPLAGHLLVGRSAGPSEAGGERIHAGAPVAAVMAPPRGEPSGQHGRHRERFGYREPRSGAERGRNQGRAGGWLAPGGRGPRRGQTVAAHRVCASTNRTASPWTGLRTAPTTRSHTVQRSDIRSGAQHAVLTPHPDAGQGAPAPGRRLPDRRPVGAGDGAPRLPPSEPRRGPAEGTQRGRGGHGNT